MVYDPAGERLTELEEADPLADEDLLYIAQHTDSEPVSRSVTVSAIRTQVGMGGNIDGGYPDSVYGGIPLLDAGGI